MRTCKADGCTKRVDGYSSLCESHKRAKARHGHPLQVGIKKTDIKPYIREIESYLSTVSATTAHDSMNDIWTRTVAAAQADIAAAQRGVPFNVHRLQASGAIVSLSEETDSVTIVKLVMAMGFWYEDDKRHWKHDDGFRFQTVRMLLRLNPREAVYKWSGNTMTRSTFKEVPPRTIEALWSIIDASKLVSYGAEIARRKAKALDAARSKVRAERDAILGPELTGGAA